MGIFLIFYFWIQHPLLLLLLLFHLISVSCGYIFQLSTAGSVSYVDIGYFNHYLSTLLLRIHWVLPLNRDDARVCSGSWSSCHSAELSAFALKLSK